MIEEKISHLNGLLQQEEVSLTPILNAAIQLADLRDDKEFRLLFEYHLQGLDPGLSTTFQNTCPTGCSMFFLDRKMLEGPNSLTGSVSSLELNRRNRDQDIATAIEEVKRVRAAQPMPTTIASAASVGVANTILAQHRKESDQTKEILNRIRLRVAEYVRNVENGLIRAKSLQTNLSPAGSNTNDPTYCDKKTGLLTHDVFEGDLEAFF